MENLIPIDAGILLAVLLPGLVAAAIKDALSEPQRREVRHFLILAAIYDAVIYLFLLLLSRIFASLTPYPAGKPFNIMTLVAAFLLAVFIGLIVGIGSSKGIWQNIFFTLGWTKKGKLNTWLDAFQHAEKADAWAYVYLKDGRRILGRPKYYSSSDEKASVYLVRGSRGEPVKIYDCEGKNPIPQLGPGVLITPAAGIILVSFLDGRPLRSDEVVD